MRHRLILLPLAFCLVLACDSANPVAPSGSVLAVTANPTQIGLTGTSLITVTGFRPDGNALFPGTQITVSTDLGTLSASVITIGDNGRGTTTLRADGRGGTATVTASLPAGEATSTATVQVGEEGIQPTLTLTASPNRINVEENATISVVARHVDGSPLADTQVRLRTTLGRLGQESLVTDARGEARTLLHPEDRSGMAEVTGSVGSSMEGMTQVTILRTRLDVTANPNIVDVNSLGNEDGLPDVLNTAEVIVQARDEDGVALTQGHEVQVTATLGLLLSGSRGQVTRGMLPTAVTSLTLTTGSDGKAFATYIAGDRAGNESLSALLENADPGMGAITIRDAPATVSLNVDPPNVTRGVESSVTLTVRVANAQGVPLGNELVRFSTSPNIGRTLDPPAGPVTNNSGEATATVTFSASSIPEGIGSFTITAIVRDVESQPQPVTVLQ